MADEAPSWLPIILSVLGAAGVAGSGRSPAVAGGGAAMGTLGSMLSYRDEYNARSSQAKDLGVDDPVRRAYASGNATWGDVTKSIEQGREKKEREQFRTAVDASPLSKRLPGLAQFLTPEAAAKLSLQMGEEGVSARLGEIIATPPPPEKVTLEEGLPQVPPGRPRALTDQLRDLVPGVPIALPFTPQEGYEGSPETEERSIQVQPEKATAAQLLKWAKETPDEGVRSRVLAELPSSPKFTQAPTSRPDLRGQYLAYTEELVKEGFPRDEATRLATNKVRGTDISDELAQGRLRYGIGAPKDFDLAPGHTRYRGAPGQMPRPMVTAPPAPVKEPATELGLIGKINDPNISEAERARARKELSDYTALKKATQEQKHDFTLDIPNIRGPWIERDKPGIEMADNLTRREWNDAGGNKAYRKITPNQQQTAQLLVSQGFPALDQMKNLVPKVLAKGKGSNLFQWAGNEFQAKVSDSDVREFVQAATTVAYEYSRATGGSSALRKFVSDMIRATEVPTLGERQVTANRMLENTRVVMMNYIRELKGSKPFAYPSLERTIDATEMRSGKTVQIKLKPYEPLPDGYEYRY